MDEEVDLSNLDCKIFVDGVHQETALIDVLAKAIGGATTRDSVVSPGIELFVVSNDDANSGDKTDPAEGFLFFDHWVEVYFACSIEHPRRVAELSNILTCLWNQSLPAVAACDYEDELPRQGGMGHRGPWPVAN